ncbi:Tyrosine-protein phosphatase yvh1 like [Verticillium longisporum]|uniref:protein-tyrosine-phosphatase n=1 Tax=Verticillium longisporum TaxID=100787 RepID=A0A8I3AY67_VERLO|nr:Tyrosine-protein phosphatase yvh1 like [Verticillium longisporum]RBQ83247.1 hypothetical protein VDGD_03768 [Verticillium dahliae]
METLDHSTRADITDDIAGSLRKSCVEMALNRIDGDEELYVGGIFALKRPTALSDRGITHVLSVVRCDPSEDWSAQYRHKVIDVDDVDDEDLLYHLPGAVRFIDDALHPKPEGKEKKAVRNGRKAAVLADVIGVATGGDATAPSDDEASDEQAEADEDTVFKAKADRLRAAAGPSQKDTPALSADPRSADPDAITPVPAIEHLSLSSAGKPGAVYVHCAMGKSRSVTAVAAYLLFKHPARFGQRPTATEIHSSVSSTAKWQGTSDAARKAVEAVVAHIRKTREIAEPNPGFISQLEMWWDMGCPVKEGELEKHPIYQRWTYKREVEESLAVGEAPSRLRFEDEERAKGGASGPGTGQEKELRCKKCRRVLATSAFVLDHEPVAGVSPAPQACQHVFVEPLSWMRPTLEQAELEGRLVCPSDRCGASLGRYSWRGFKCSCGGWVTPAFSLARGRVDEVRASVGVGAGTGADAEAARRAQRAALGIRMPAGAGGGNGRL